jgi:hypothetical protein
MARRRFQPMPDVTQDDIAAALAADRGVFAVSAYTSGQHLFLKFAFRTGDISTIYMDPIRADYIFRILREVLPNRGENDGSPLSWAEDAIAVSHGRLP